MQPPSIDNFYWIFSSAAQSVAAMIAFLLAGITLAFSIMDRIADKDPSLFEVTEALKVKHHRIMSCLAITAGLAIATNLLSTFINPYPGCFRNGSMVLAAITTLISIVGAVYFVIMIISPNRYQNEARREIGQIGKRNADGESNANNFFHEFLELEKDIRLFLRNKDLYVPSRGEPRMTYSFRQMVDALYQNEIVGAELRDQLIEINKFRNLIFHGHLEKIPNAILRHLKSTKEQWYSVKNKRSSKE